MRWQGMIIFQDYGGFEIYIKKLLWQLNNSKKQINNKWVRVIAWLEDVTNEIQENIKVDYKNCVIYRRHWIILAILSDMLQQTTNFAINWALDIWSLLLFSISDVSQVLSLVKDKFKIYSRMNPRNGPLKMVHLHTSAIVW